jgi:aldose 1-epimerase
MEAPATPPGWEDVPERLYAIDAPDGQSRAWVCPELGANTIGYAVQVGDGWRHVLAVTSPELTRESPSRYGMAILFPFPGHMREQRYTWGGTEYRVPPTYGSGGTNVVHGFAHTRPWQLVRQAPSHIVCEVRTPNDLEPEQAAVFPFKLRVLLSLTIEDHQLDVRLTAYNEGDTVAPLGMGLHPYIGEDVLGPDRSVVRVDLPGATERLLPVPPPAEGAVRRPAPAGPVSVVPLGETMAVARTDLGDHAEAVVRDLPPLDGRSGWTVVFAMDAGYKHVLMFAPNWQNSLSIEPQTVTPGAASYPVGHVDALAPLEPDASYTATMTLRLVPPAE